MGDRTGTANCQAWHGGRLACALPCSSWRTPLKVPQHPLLALVPLFALALLVACESERPSSEGLPAGSPSGASAPSTTGAASQPVAAPSSAPTLPPVATATTTSPPAASQAAEVVAVVDGDTIDVRMDGRTQRVRLILVDTPEVFGATDCFGPEASAFTKRTLPAGSRLSLEKDVSETDRFGRLLRYVYLADGRMLNEVLVAEGYAQVATFPPDVKHLERMTAAQRGAREGQKGLWSSCRATPTATSSPAAGGPAIAPRGNCSPSYPTVCIPPSPPDLDCGQITFRRFQVLPPDPHRFDSDSDGIGCES